MINVMLKSSVEAWFLVLLFSEVNSGFFYKSAAEREKLVAAERKFTDDKVQKVIDLKRKVRRFCYLLSVQRKRNEDVSKVWRPCMDLNLLLLYVFEPS